MHSLARLLRRSSRDPVVTFCESCGEACTSACRANARLDRDRTAVLRGGLPR